MFCGEMATRSMDLSAEMKLFTGFVPSSYVNSGFFGNADAVNVLLFVEMDTVTGIDARTRGLLESRSDIFFISCSSLVFYSDPCSS